MTLQEWKSKYEKEAEEFILLPGFTIYYEPDKGFFCWKKTGDYFEIDHTCTNNIRYIFNVMNDIAKNIGCKIIITSTKHDPAAFMRLLKCTPNIELSGIRPNGHMYWVMERRVV